MRFLRIVCEGVFNSFRQPDFHTYHKTLPLPPKTTIAGMIGSALGISPRQVNEEWLLKERFKAGIVGSHSGEANDLWQIRKYESKQIKAFQIGKEGAPYKTAIIVREILYKIGLTIYLSFYSAEDYGLIQKALEDPKWALSLGREDELIKIQTIKELELQSFLGEQSYKNTIIPDDITNINYRLELDTDYAGNLLKMAPKSVNLPISFTMAKDSEVRNGNDYRRFTFIGSLPIRLEDKGYFDEELGNAFQIF